MINIIALVLILIEVSIATKFVSGIFVLPYMLYLADKGDKRTLVDILLIILIYSLQNSKFYAIFTVICLINIGYYLILQHFEYKKVNLILFSIIQTALLFPVYKEYATILTLSINFVGISIVNYICITKFKRKSGDYEKNKEKKFFRKIRN